VPLSGLEENAASDWHSNETSLVGEITELPRSQLRAITGVGFELSASFALGP